MLDVKELADFDPRFNPEALLSRLSTSLDYLVSSLTPDLQIPWVGNSPAVALNERVRAYAERTLGKSLREHVAGLSGTAFLYPYYGHAIVREEDGFYLLFHAAQNLPAIKRHADALSFILLNKGRVWITEGGLAGFKGNERSDMMSYLWSPYAHNTYLYGDDYIKAQARRDLDAYMRGMTVEGDDLSFEAFSERYPEGVFVTRRLTVDRNTHDIAIHDVLSVPEPDGTCFHGSLHFAPDLQIQVDPATSTVTASDSGSGSLTVEISSEHLSGIQRFSGQKDPIRGWGTVGEAFGPVQTVVYDVCGTGPVDLSLRWSGIS
jgi:Heparinase II/III-like protein